jgi:two-component sensor histidine kinase
MTNWLGQRLIGRSLVVQVLLFLSVALLPIGLIAVYQTNAVIHEAEELGERDILARTARAARAEFALINLAWGSAFALGTTAMDLGADTLECDAAMARFVDQSQAFVFAGYFDKNGMMSCLSSGDPLDLSADEDFKLFFENPSPMVAVKLEGQVTGLSVIIATVPLFDAKGALIGGASISIPHRLTDNMLTQGVEDIFLALVKGDGTVFSASTGIDDAEQFRMLNIVPSEISMDEDGSTLTVTSADGEDAILAIVPLVSGQIYAVGKWSRENQPSSVSLLGTTAPAFPVIMWLASLFVAVFAVDRLVLRHLNRFRIGMSEFSFVDGRDGYVRLRNAPAELSEIAASYNGLIDRIDADHTELEANVREKEILLKEVHHRVKNNLQLIASILNMQIRSIESDDAQRVLRRVQDRVMSLATIHKSLYSGAHVDVVRVDRLIDEIARGLFDVASTSQTNIATHCNLSPVSLDPDQAVPLSLLVTEAVTNALKYAGNTADTGAFVNIELEEPAPDQILLTVTNSRGELEPDVDPRGATGLGSQLIQAFASQLDGKLQIKETDAEYMVQLSFSRLEASHTQAQAAK